MYPPVEPYDHGMLGVGDGNRVYWETCALPSHLPHVIRTEIQAQSLRTGPGGATPGGRG